MNIETDLEHFLGHKANYKFSQTTPIVLISTAVLQKWCPHWNPHPDIPTMIKRDLHGETYPDYFPDDTVGTLPNAGWQPRHHTGDAKQPVQVAPLSNACMLHKDGVNCSAPHYLAPHPPQAQPIPLPVTPHRTSHLPFHLAPLGAKPPPKTIAQNCLALNHIAPHPPQVQPMPLWLSPGPATPLHLILPIILFLYQQSRTV